MKHLESFLEMLKTVKVLFEVEKRGTSTVVTVHNSGNEGYCGFLSEWKFDMETGKLLSVGHWE